MTDRPNAEERALFMCSDILGNEPHQSTGRGIYCKDCEDLTTQIREAERAAAERMRERCAGQVYDDRQDGLPWKSCKARIRALPTEEE